jgi:protein-S-isoprenylcysteine O-methyltransferase Ste14
MTGVDANVNKVWKGPDPEDGKHLTRRLTESLKDDDSMSGEDESASSWRYWALSYTYGACMIVQIGLTVLNYNSMGLDGAANLGWLIMGVSGVFGWLPMYTFKSRGGVPDGESYMKTTVLVDSGIYSVVRHPQFLAGILISLSLALISQYWLNVLLIAPVVVGTVLDSRRADADLLVKFGEDYRRYMEEVPGLNFIVGITRKLS